MIVSIGIFYYDAHYLVKKVAPPFTLFGGGMSSYLFLIKEKEKGES